MKQFLKKIWFDINNKKIHLEDRSVKIGRKVSVYPEFWFEGNNVIGKNTVLRGGHIGSMSYVGNNCKLNADIGRFCSIADNVQVINAVHPTKTFVSIHPAFYSTAKQSGKTYVSDERFEEYKYYDTANKIACLIGNDVWICNNAVIMGGVRIGDGAIIAANAVVTKDVPPYAIVGGVPAKVIRYRFDSDTVNALTELKWWDRSEVWLKEHASNFVNIEEFIKSVR